MQRILVCDADARTVRALRVVLRDAGDYVTKRHGVASRRYRKGLWAS